MIYILCPLLMPYWIYVFYVGYVDKSSLYETLFHCNILSKHHHHPYIPRGGLIRKVLRDIYSPDIARC